MKAKNMAINAVNSFYPKASSLFFRSSVDKNAESFNNSLLLSMFSSMARTLTAVAPILGFYSNFGKAEAVDYDGKEFFVTTTNSSAPVGFLFQWVKDKFDPNLIQTLLNECKIKLGDYDTSVAWVSFDEVCKVCSEVLTKMSITFADNYDGVKVDRNVAQCFENVIDAQCDTSELCPETKFLIGFLSAIGGMCALGLVGKLIHNCTKRKNYESIPDENNHQLDNIKP